MVDPLARFYPVRGFARGPVPRSAPFTHQSERRHAPRHKYRKLDRQTQ